MVQDLVQGDILRVVGQPLCPHFYEALTCVFQQLPYDGKYVDPVEVKVLNRLR